MIIVLIGYMGSGKSTVGKRLAATLNANFIDLDTAIENREGSSVSELFRAKGEIYFRRKENEILKNLIENIATGVIATGGGTPCYADTMPWLLQRKDVTTVYLKTSLELLTKRLYAERASRPLIEHLQDADTLQDFIRKHLFERSYYYRQASLVIDTSEKDIATIVEEIILKLF
ncbi:shikimate kinase [Altibacter sp.]|uniref:shikimate kinase n=1 Tax=Altibacter sp. TaxID=2024823 RepID=UPI000C944FE5|nr:shikimate kinase [Altibacter sp.]MAP55410.1 shikimate kinase [Altibacter sp.]